MRAMRIRRRLFFCLLSVSSLLCIYILCVCLEIRVPWHMVDPAGTHRTDGSPRISGTGDSVASSAVTTSPQPFSEAVLPKVKMAGAAAAVTTVAATTTKATLEIRRPATKPEPADGKGAGVKSTRADPGGPHLQTRQPRQATKATEPPYIGDSYYVDDVPPQTTCPDGIRAKMAATERFLSTIPVLQWAKHATPEEHRRLQQYPAPHGLANISYETLVGGLSVLNTSANWQMFDDWSRRSKGSLCIRCAVVGNGGILKNSLKGKEIDGHDYVFRTNGAVIKGFEQDVGSRTTHYAFSTNTMRNSMSSYASVGFKGPPVSEETRYVFIPDHDRDYLLVKAAATQTPVEKGPEHSNFPPKYFGDNVSAEKLKMYHPDFVRYLRNRFLRAHALKTKYKDIYRPSTGAVMLLGALHTCDQVNAYGFMTQNYSKYSDHYYDKEHHSVIFYINHDLHMELALWQELHHAGLMRLYMRL